MGYNNTHQYIFINTVKQHNSFFLKKIRNSQFFKTLLKVAIPDSCGCNFFSLHLIKIRRFFCSNKNLQIFKNHFWKKISKILISINFPWVHLMSLKKCVPISYDVYWIKTNEQEAKKWMIYFNENKIVKKVSGLIIFFINFEKTIWFSSSIYEKVCFKSTKLTIITFKNKKRELIFNAKKKLIKRCEYVHATNLLKNVRGKARK